jgi:enoyl-CoA hydratase
MEYGNLQVEINDGIALVTINRPDKLNALNTETIHELEHCMDVLQTGTHVQVVVLRGAGEKAFVAGADISELANMSASQAETLAEAGQKLMNRIENLGKPVIAAINGFALGGGCELAMACTFRYAADTAKLGLPETGLGLIPGFGGTQRLPRLVGRGRALEMILTGDMITAVDAMAIGLVNKVYAQDDLMNAVRDVAGALVNKSPLTARVALKAVNEGLGMNQDSGCRLEAALFGVAGGSEDAREGCQAFLEKRKPEFKNR